VAGSKPQDTNHRPPATVFMATIKVQLTVFAGAADEVASVVIRQTIYDLEATIKEAMARPKHGRLYPRGSRVHQTSAACD
jgi:hypothetical protein